MPDTHARTSSEHPQHNRTDSGSTTHWRQIVDEPGETGRARIFALPEEQWSHDAPSLLLVAASFRAPGMSRPEATLSYLDAADAAIEHGEYDLEFLVVSIVLRAMADRALGRLQMAVDRLTQAARVLRSDGISLHERIGLTTLIDVNRGICELLQGSCARARRSLAGALQLGGEELPSSVRIEAHGCLAIVEMLGGGIANADAHIALARSLEEQLAAHGICGAPARIAAATLAIERGRAADAVADLDDLHSRTAHTEYEPLVLHVLARIHSEHHDLEATTDLLQQMQLVIRDWTGTSSLAHTLHDLGSADVLIRRQQSAAARVLLDSLNADSAHALCLATRRARIELERGDYEAAAALVAPCVAMGDRHAPFSFSYALAASAAAHVALGDNATADDRFAYLLGLLAVNGFRRPATWLPFGLLQRLIQRTRRDELSSRAGSVLDDLTGLLPQAERSDARPLSTRERLILQRLETGRSHAQIASELRVSPNTVKSQVRSLYSKLGVESRSGAVQRARALGLLE